VAVSGIFDLMTGAESILSSRMIAKAALARFAPGDLFEAIRGPAGAEGDFRRSTDRGPGSASWATCASVM